jgi:hypothetical protein
MRIVLVGAPGSGKEDLANAILAALVERGTPGIGPVGDAQEIVSSMGYAVGPIADYRTELLVAVDRAFEMTVLGDDIDAVYTGTLLDNVAHTLVILSAGINSGAFSQGEALRWDLTSQLAYGMMIDSFKADHVFFLGGGESDLAEFYPELLSQVQVDYVELGDDPLDRLETVLQKLEADEPRPDNGDTEPKDA